MTDTEMEKLKNHVEEFPIRDAEIRSLIEANKKQTDEMRKEWDELKKWAMIFLVGSIVAAFGYGVYVKSLQTSVENVQLRMNAYEGKVDSIDRRQQLSDISNAEIKTKLTGIETSLLEIKASIKQIK